MTKYKHVGFNYNSHSIIADGVKFGSTVPLLPLQEVVDKVGISRDELLVKMVDNKIPIYSVQDEVFVDVVDVKLLTDEVDHPCVTN